MELKVEIESVIQANELNEINAVIAMSRLGGNELDMIYRMEKYKFKEIIWTRSGMQVFVSYPNGNRILTIKRV